MNTTVQTGADTRTMTIRATTPTNRIDITICGIPRHAAETVGDVVRALLNGLEPHLEDGIDGEIILGRTVGSWRL